MTRLDLTLGAGLLASLGLHWILAADPTRPTLEVFPAMVRSARYNTFAPNPNFDDGATLRTPVPGTIPRGVPPFPYPATRLGGVRAGDELANPFAGDDAQVAARGAEVYARFCTPCHGPDGRGGGPVVERGFARPPTLLRPLTLRMKDGEIFHILTYGRGRMAPLAAQVAREDRWKAILHLRALQRQAPPPPAGGAP